MPRRKRQSAEEDQKPHGQWSMFRAKRRTPVSLTFTEGHHALIEAAVKETFLTRNDLMGYLVHKYASEVTLDEVIETMHEIGLPEAEIEAFKVGALASR